MAASGPGTVPAGHSGAGTERGLTADLPHAGAGLPVSHAAIDQIHRSPRRLWAGEQQHAHLQHRPVGLVPGRNGDRVAVVELLLLKALHGALPVANNLRSISISLFSSCPEIEASCHQFVDVSDAHVGITNVCLNPAKGKNNRLLR